MAEQRAGRHPGSADGSRLTRDELATRADVTPERVDELTDAGILRPGSDRRYVAGDVDRIRIIGAFTAAGVPVDALAAAVRSGAVSLAYYDQLHPDVGERSSRTFGQFKALLGDRAALVERLLTAFGLTLPDDERRLSAADDRMLAEAVDVIGTIGRTDLALRVARLLGEGARRTSEAALDVYALAADDVERRAAGLPGEEVYERYLSPWSRLAQLAPRLAAWLHERHLSAAIDAYSVDATERVLEENGFMPLRQTSPPAVAFVDLTGFTQLAEERGDQAAASLAMQLGTLAEEVARRHAGSVVKLLGDGVLLRFSSPVAAVEASLELLAALPIAGLPAGHAGVHAGRLVVREGDVFGRTVNLASRLSDRAEPGEVLISEATAVVMPQANFRCAARGSVELQGIPRPIKVFAVSPASEMA